MIRIFRFLVVVLLAGPSAFASANDWPTWRGPKSDGIANDPRLPISWSNRNNIAWKTPLTGQGHSSPIVAAGKIFLTSFDPEQNTRELLCFDRTTGKELWRKVVVTAPPEKMHKNNTPASSTPVANDRFVWTTFLDGDSVAVACYSHTGQQIWLKKPGKFVSQHGFCGSPILFEKTVIINGDNDGDAFLAALDQITGETKWIVPRPNRVRSFSVPIIHNVAGQPQLILAGSKSITAYEPATGQQIWIVNSPTVKFVATVVATRGLVFATGTSPVNTLTAIDPTGRGDVTKSHVRWSDTKTASYVPTPLAFRDRLFVLSDSGIGTLLEATTGRKIWSERLPGRLYHASPLLLNDQIYCLADDGTTVILSASDSFELLAKNALGEGCHATPAVSNGQLILRGVGHLWCIGSGDKTPPREDRIGRK